MEPLKKIRFITDENGNRQSVVIPVETYEEMLEDIKDLVAVAERANEESVSLDELKKTLKADGLL